MIERQNGLLLGFGSRIWFRFRLAKKRAVTLVRMRKATTLRWVALYMTRILKSLAMTQYELMADDVSPSD